MPSQFGKFVAVGGAGFVVDATLLSLLSSSGVDPWLGRLVSFPVAVTVTWLLHRKWTFKNTAANAERSQEYARYWAVQAVGCLINLLFYYSLLLIWPILTGWPAVALAAGSAAAMLFNFTASRRYVFVHSHLGV